MKHEQPELWEIHFYSREHGDRKVPIVGTVDQVVPEMKKTLQWRSDRWTLKTITRIGLVHIAPSVEQSSKSRLPELS